MNGAVGLTRRLCLRDFWNHIVSGFSACRPGGPRADQASCARRGFGRLLLRPEQRQGPEAVCQARSQTLLLWCWLEWGELRGGALGDMGRLLQPGAPQRLQTKVSSETRPCPTQGSSRTSCLRHSQHGGGTSLPCRLQVPGTLCLHHRPGPGVAPDVTSEAGALGANALFGFMVCVSQNREMNQPCLRLRSPLRGESGCPVPDLL